MKHELVAIRLRNAMNREGLRAIDLSEKTGIGKSSISHYCNGRCVPSFKHSQQMAKVLHVSPLWLIGHDVSEQEGSYDPIIEKFYKLEPDRQKIVRELIEFLSE